MLLPEGRVLRSTYLYTGVTSWHQPSSLGINLLIPYLGKILTFQTAAQCFFFDGEDFLLLICCRARLTKNNNNNDDVFFGRYATLFRGLLGDI